MAEAKARKAKVPALATDHLVAVDRIANMPELTGFLEIYQKASDAVKANMTADLVALGDKPSNLVRMNADANGSTLKWNNSWHDIKYDQAKRFGYERGDVDAMRLKEDAAMQMIRDAIGDLVKHYKGLISGTAK